MKVAVLHTKDAIDGEEDPVLGQLEQALRNGGHEPRRVMVDASVEPVVQELTSDRPDLVINLAERDASNSTSMSEAVPRSTEKGRKRETSRGIRSAT